MARLRAGRVKACDAYLSVLGWWVLDVRAWEYFVSVFCFVGSI